MYEKAYIYTQAINILTHAFSLIKHSIDWCKGNRFQTINGTPINSPGPESVSQIRRFSLDGAVQMAYAKRMKANSGLEPVKRTIQQDLKSCNIALEKVCNMPVAQFNDNANTTFVDVKNAILQAIEFILEEELDCALEIFTPDWDTDMMAGYI